MEGVTEDACLVGALAVIFFWFLDETRRGGSSDVGGLSNLGGDRVGKVLDRSSDTGDDVVKTIETSKNVLCCDHHWRRFSW